VAADTNLSRHFHFFFSRCLQELWATSLIGGKLILTNGDMDVFHISSGSLF